MDKISVNLYGGKGIFGGKETPLEADVIYCDKYNDCTFYKDNKCLRCRAFLLPTCKFGRTETAKGYTSRARKYYDFKSKYSKDEKYNLLKYPSSSFIGIVDNCVLLKIPFLSLKKENSEYIAKTPFGSELSAIPLEDFNLKLISKICYYSPRAMMGGIILDYPKEKIPEFLRQLKNILPNLHAEFIKENPQFDKEPNYIGKYAYINTMVDGSILTDCHGNKFIFKNGILCCDEMKRGFVPFDGIAKIEVKVKDSKTYKVDNNSQCDENTKFE